MGIESQPPEAVGRSVALLMADQERKGQCIFSKRGKYKEVNRGLMAAISIMSEMDDKDMPNDPEKRAAFQKMFDTAQQNT